MTTCTRYRLGEVRPSRNIIDHPLTKHPYISFLRFCVYGTFQVCIPIGEGYNYVESVPEATELIQDSILAIDRSALLDCNNSSSAFNFMSRHLSSHVDVPDYMHKQIIERVSMVARQLMIDSDGNCPGMSIDVSVEAMVTQVMELNELEENMVRYIEESTGANAFRPTPATKSSIETLEKVTFEGSETANQCAICMEEFELEMELSRLPCLHIYHGDCVAQWLETSRTCPLCRFQMPYNS